MTLEDSSINEVLDSYLVKLKEAQDSMNKDEVLNMFQTLLDIRRKGSVLFLAGNGGSSTTSQHFAVDLGIGGIHRNSIIRSISLSDSQGAITALANDRNFESVFEAQLSVLAREGDSLMVISASGNSKNLINVVSKAKSRGMITLGLLGFDGGELRKICDQSVLVKTEKGEYGIVEDIHLSVCHIFTEALRSTI
jgi:D-sedoheptulose 7-phosphate isomerase